MREGGRRRARRAATARPNPPKRTQSANASTQSTSRMGWPGGGNTALACSVASVAGESVATTSRPRAPRRSFATCPATYEVGVADMAPRSHNQRSRSVALRRWARIEWRQPIESDPVEIGTAI